MSRMAYCLKLCGMSELGLQAVWKRFFITRLELGDNFKSVQMPGEMTNT